MCKPGSCLILFLKNKIVFFAGIVFECFQTVSVDDSDDEPHPHDMEYCDPCYCYGKCCLDVVASIFCVSLL